MLDLPRLGALRALHLQLPVVVSGGPSRRPGVGPDWLQNSGAEGPALQRRGLGILEISDTSCQDRRDTLRRPCRRVRSRLPPAAPGAAVAPGPGPDKEATRIRAMFGRVAPRYDLLNHLLSASLDRLWRRRLARSLALAPDARLLDLCCGTGDQATRSRRAAAAGSWPADFCLPMLAFARPKFARRAGRRRPLALQADALALPFPDRRFDGATVSFGLRNVADLDARARRARAGAAAGRRARRARVRDPASGSRSAPSTSSTSAACCRAIGRLALGATARRTATCRARCSAFPQREAFVARLHRRLRAGRFTSLSARCDSPVSGPPRQSICPSTAADGSDR